MAKDQIQEACKNCSEEINSFCSILCEHPEVQKSCITFKKGQLLFHEDTNPKGVYCINSGKIKIYKTSLDAKEHIISIVGTGALIGFAPIIAEGTHEISAKALEECHVCFISRKDFLKVLQTSPELKLKLLKEACKRNGGIIESLFNIAVRPVKDRLAVCLLMLKEVYNNSNTASPVEINLTREEISSIVGTSAETVVRLLKEMERDNLIQITGRKILITNEAKLFKIGKIY
ncbi:MAG: Crp/Fnr family transcriptional regulator [Cytophagaceae bacterium]|nr:Crp/Fnr family transcriptional regulator [Cytophagaceae bacterium]